MSSSRSRLVFALGTLLAVACGGTVVPDPGGSSSGSSGSSSGASGTSGSSSGSTGSSGISSSSGTSGGNCVEGQQGPDVCVGGCGGGRVPEVCRGGQWVCPPVPPCPPPTCGGPPPLCGCPANCICGAQCNPESGWTCTASCSGDDGGAPFACGDKNCVPGDVCIDVAGDDAGTQTGPYECLPNPAVCASDYSCGCELKAIEAAGTCKPVSCDQTFGNVVVHCASL